MLIEERYRAALVALRDGQWEEATTHLLTIAAGDPTYRDVDRVLEVLQRTRSVSYWCAAFTIARARDAYESARVALEQITALAPTLPRLAALRQSLAEIAPPAEQGALLQDATDHASVRLLPADQDETPHDSQADAMFTARNDSLDGLELDPLTELLFDERWVQLSRHASPAASGDHAPAAAGAAEVNNPVAVEAPSPANMPDDFQPIGDSAESAVPDHDADMAGSVDQSESTPSAASATSTDAQPVPLPAEPEGEFIRLVPTALKTEEPAMAADPQLDQSAEKQARVESSPQHRYSVLQLLGLLTFPLILVVATAYVLFGQGAPTLIDMLREAQAGIAINSTLDLINAVDTQLLLPAETDSVESQLAVFASLAEMLAEEAPELEAALSAWIDTGRELTAARAALAEACTAAESQACEAARQEVAALAAQAETQRELVCGLTTCPTQQPGSVNS